MPLKVPSFDNPPAEETPREGSLQELKEGALPLPESEGRYS